MRLARLLTHTAALSALLLPSLAQGQGEGIMRVTCVFDGDQFTQGVISVDGKALGQCPKADIFVKSGQHQVSVAYEPKDGGDIKQYKWAGSVTVAPNVPLRIMADLKLVYSEAYVKRKLAEEESAKQQKDATQFQKSLVDFWKLASLSLIGHTDFVTNVSISPNGRYVGTAGYDSTARVWNSDSGELIWRFNVKGRVFSTFFSPDGENFAAADETGTVTLWDLKAGQIWGSIRESASILGVAFSPDGKLIATASSDSFARIYSYPSMRLLQTLKGHRGMIHSIAFSPNGKSLTTASADGRAIIWNVSNGDMKNVLSGHGSNVLRVAYSPDGEKIATASADNTVRIWSSLTGNQLTVIDRIREDANGVSFSHNGGLLAVGTSNASRRLILWNLISDEEIIDLKGHTNNVYSTTFDKNGRILVSGSLDKTAVVWPIFLIGSKNIDDLWKKIKTSPNQRIVSAFIKSFPDSKYISEAKKIYEELK